MLPNVYGEFMKVGPGNFANSAHSAVQLPSLLEVTTPLGILTVRRPSMEEMVRTATEAKSIFMESFSTNYTEYYRQSGSTDSIERWLRLKPGLNFCTWLSAVFDEEYNDCSSGKKSFLYLCGPNGKLIGWISHTPVSEKGEVYFSTLTLEAAVRCHRVATAAIAEGLKINTFRQLFPGAKEIRIITRKINVIAQRLYLKAGFTQDEAIDPSVYGECYDDRYIGFRLALDQ
jgi:ribosomal protein S18 acetylase RimI-like enzyme